MCSFKIWGKCSFKHGTSGLVTAVFSRLANLVQSRKNDILYKYWNIKPKVYFGSRTVRLTSFSYIFLSARTVQEYMCEKAKSTSAHAKKVYFRTYGHRSILWKAHALNWELRKWSIPTWALRQTMWGYGKVQFSAHTYKFPEFPHLLKPRLYVFWVHELSSI